MAAPAGGSWLGCVVAYQSAVSDSGNPSLRDVGLPARPLALLGLGTLFCAGF
jgi:hypothetical protein